jgi:uncharacterized protein (DUF58 family)
VRLEEGIFVILDSEFLQFLEKMKIIFKIKYNSSFIGERVSGQRGSGLDFKDFRPYQIGDDYRYIDWNLYSRLEQLFLKEFIEEKGTTIYLMIDQSKSMAIGRPGKISKAVEIAAAIGYIALNQMDRVIAAFFSDRLNFVSRKIKGKNQIHDLFNILEQAETQGETDISSAIFHLVHRYKKPGVVVLISDLITDRDLYQGLKVLKMQGWKVLVVHLLAGEDLSPQLGESLSLVDAENNQKKDIYIDEELLVGYRKNITAYNSSVEDFFRGYAISYLQVTNQQELKFIIYQLFGMGKEIN